MTTLRISITAEVLEATKDCQIDGCLIENCAVSYAVREIWPGAQTFKTPSIIAPFGLIDKRVITHDQNKFITKFDTSTPAERATMQPFSFEIEVPDEVIGEVNIEEICAGSKTLELVN